jgi:glycosyltransferase involved in cell wall biosynthesis
VAFTSDIVPVTAIIPTYNRAEFLREAITSVLAQTRPPAEILVVDDGSTDETPAVVTAFGSRVSYLRQENQGKAAAINRALTVAERPCVWIFDDDDIAHPAALERLYGAIITRPECGFAYGLCDRFTGSWPAPTSPPYPAYSAPSRAILYIRLLEGIFMWQGAVLVRRQALAEVGPFNTALLRSQDYDMMLRLARRFESISIPYILFHQRQHSGVRGPKSISSENRAQVEVIWDKFDQIIFRNIHRSHKLVEFLYEPRRAEFGPRELVTALIQRAAIMGRKGIWDLATADLEAAAEQARLCTALVLNGQELTALRGVFYFGARSRFDNLSEGQGFFAAADRFSDARLRSAIKAALMWPMPYRFMKFVREEPSLVKAHELCLILRCAGVGAVLRTFRSRKLDVDAAVTMLRPLGI